MKSKTMPAGRDMIRVCGHDSRDALEFVVGGESWLVSNGQVWRPRHETAPSQGGVVLETVPPPSPWWLAIKAAVLAGCAALLLVGVVAAI